MQPHPHGHVRIGRPRLVCERLLRRYCSRDRAPRAGEDGEERVARRIDFRAARRLDRFPEQFPLPFQELAVAVAAQPLDRKSVV